MRHSFFDRCGISFVEVMTTVVILSVGLVAIYRSFFNVMDFHRHVVHRLYASNFMTTKIEGLWKEAEASTMLALEPRQGSLQFLFGGRAVSLPYMITFTESSDAPNLYAAQIVMQWKEGQRDIRLSRSAYVYCPSQAQ